MRIVIVEDDERSCASPVDDGAARRPRTPFARATWSNDRATPSLADGLIAATAWRLEATILTRDAADFEGFGVAVLGYGEAT
jgi:predicted nucleic acid-binding protein